MVVDLVNLLEASKSNCLLIMAKIKFDICRTDKGQSHLLERCPECEISLWEDEREKILSKIELSGGRLDTGLKIYSVSYYSREEWIVRCIEIIDSVDSRPRSNITMSIKVPAKYTIGGGRVLPIFDAIKEDIGKSTPSVGLLQKLEYKDKGSTCNAGVRNGRYGFKTYASEAELIELLDNLLQPGYSKYEKIYFIPESCRFNGDDNYINLGKGIDKIQSVQLETQEPIAGVVFVPTKKSILFFESNRIETEVTYSFRGYKDIVKYVNDLEIRRSEVLKEIRISESFYITPYKARVECWLDQELIKEEDGIFYLQYDRLRDCEFRIVCDGYETQTCKFSPSKQTIDLKEIVQKVRVTLHTEDKKEDKVDINVYRSSYGGNVPSSMHLCTSEYFLKLKEKAESKSVTRGKLVLWVCVAMIVGICLGGVAGHYMFPKKVIINNIVYENEDDSTTEDKIDDDKRRENYLAQECWLPQEHISDTTMLEPKGLYNAMNRFSYVDIENIYNGNQLKGLSSKGNLEKVYQVIEQYGTNCKKPEANYSEKLGNNCINIDKWIELVTEKNVNVILGTSSSSSNNVQKRCKYCNKLFTSGVIEKHEQKCEANPLNQQP